MATVMLTMQAAIKAQRDCEAEIEVLEESTHRLLAELNDGELDRLLAQYVLRTMASPVWITTCNPNSRMFRCRHEELTQKCLRDAAAFSQLIITTLSEATSHKQYVSDRLAQLRQGCVHAKTHIAQLL